MRKLLLFFFVLFFSCSGPQPETGPVEIKSNVSFAADIYPIITHNCVNCHIQGGAGPFPLTTYTEVKRKASTITRVTQSRFMPPWPADVTYRHFIGEKRLSDTQIAVLAAWAKAGCPAGDTANLDPLPLNYEGYAGMHAIPDMVLKMKEPFKIKGNNKDIFLLMKFPYEVPQDTFIRYIEFVPDKKRLVHHVNGFLIQYDDGKKTDVNEGDWYSDTQENDYKSAYEKMNLANDDGKTFPMLTPSAVNYLPGAEPALYPSGIGGFKIKKKGAIFLKDIHYGPSPVDTVDNSYFNIYFAPTAPKRPLLELQMGTLGISPVVPKLVIPPDSVKTFTTEVKTPFDISLVTVNPHMHLLGKSFWAFAITPSGDTIPLIRINKWDFRWQYFYTFPKMLKLPKGSTIKAIGVYDNTKNNPLNPFNPPRVVAEREGSMRTSDEMFQFIINYVPYQPGDENTSLKK